MKNVGVCQECGRNVYTNEIELCKRCHKRYGAKYSKEAGLFEEEEKESGPGVEDLDLGEDEGTEPEEEKESKEKED